MSKRSKLNALNKAFITSREWSQAAAGMGAKVSPAAQRHVLTLSLSNKPMTATELAEKMGLSTASVGRIVQQLTAQGIVEAVRDAEDTRKVQLRLTSKLGAALAEL